MEKDLNSFFNAKSIAVIGASNTEGKVGNILMKKLKSYKGKVIPINKSEKKVLNIKSYKKILDYPKKIELAIIAIPGKFIPKIILECVKKEIKNIIIISSGFSEIGNNKLQNKIIRLKQKYNLNILGPNCFGIINQKKNLDLTFAKQKSKKGDTVFISQSGALGSYVIDFNIGLRGFISLGNMIDLEFADWIEYFNKDKKVKKIVCYIEKLKDGKRFLEVCKNSSKKIIVVKSGKTEKGQKAILSHTASLGTDSKIYSGVFKQAKIKEVNSLIQAFGIKPEKIDAALKGKKIAIITNAGGAGALLTDQLEQKDYEVDLLEDILGTAKPNDYKKALQKLKPAYDSILVVLTPQTMSEAEETARIILSSRYKEKIIACFLGEKSISSSLNFLRKHKIPYCTKCV
ncbi:MAG: CoA-binding protein [Nanoarchaeota archaeon]|nr:CoA-binding protein [Nanoarchaeota archaeon]